MYSIGCLQANVFVANAVAAKDASVLAANELKAATHKWLRCKQANKLLSKKL